jgi:hypothetical protein
MNTDDSKVTDRTAVRGSSGREVGLQADQDNFHTLGLCAWGEIAEQRQREIDQLQQALAVSDGIRQQLEQERDDLKALLTPNDGPESQDGRFLLNAYGRRCFDAGVEAEKNRKA